MPLQKQTIDFPFMGNLDERTDPKVLPNGRLALMENANLDKEGKLQKRNGHTLQSKTIDGGGSIASAKRLGCFGSELLLANGMSLFSKNVEPSAPWTNRGSFVTSRLTERLIVSQTADTNTQLTIGYANGYYVVIYYMNIDIGGLASDHYYAVINADSGAVIQKDILFRGTPIVPNQPVMPRAVSIASEDKVHIIYANTAGSPNINAMTFDLTDPSAAPSETVLVATSHTVNNDKGLDAIPDIRDNGYFYLTYWGSAGVDTLYIAPFNANLTPQSSIFLGGSAARGGRLSLCMSSDNRVWCVSEDGGGTDINVCAIDATDPTSIANSFGITNIETGLSANSVQSVTCAPTASNTIRAFYDQFVSGTTLSHNATIRAADISGLGTVTNVGVFLRSVFIGSRAWSRSNVPYLVAGHNSIAFATPTATASATPQHTMFIANNSGDIVGRCLVARALGGIGASLSDVVFPSTDKTVFCAWRRGQEIIGTYERGDIVAIEIEYDKAGNMVEFAENVFSPQAMLYNYDGDTIAEHGFHLYPHGITETGAITPGSLGDGTWFVKYTYEWFDNKGRWHRSAPSAPHQFTVSGTPPTVKWRVEIPTLRLTGKTKVWISVYRTLDNSTGPYYREAVITNDPTVDTVTYDMNALDSNLQTRATLYTDSGELDHIAPAPASHAIAHGSRVFLLGTDGKIYHSKYRQIELGLGFNDGLFIVPDAGDGKPRGISSQDGQLIIGTEKRLLAVTGNGPNDLGAGGYPNPVTLASDVGVADGNRMFGFSGGTLIPSPKGLWLLGRGLGLEYIGETLQDSLAGDLIAAALHPVRNDLVMIYDDGGGNAFNLQILDLDRKQWKVHTIRIPGAVYLVDAVACARNFYLGFSDGGVALDDTAVFTNVSNNYSLKAKTGDIRLAGLTGYQRIWEVRLLGEWWSTHTIHMKIIYPDGTAETKTKVINSDIEPYVVRIQPQKQAVGNIAVEVWETTASGTRQALDMYGLSFDIGVRSKRPLEAAKTL